MKRRPAFAFYAALICLAPFLAAIAVAQKESEEKTLWQPFYVTPRDTAGQQHIALDANWQLSWRDTQIKNADDLARGQVKWIEARVPNTVQMSMHYAGELPHPYYNLNSKKYEWVDEKVWYYRNRFTIPESARGRNVYLVFDGIDYYARVWLNGTLLGRHEGMFGGPAINISEAVRPGAENEVLVEVRAGNWGNKANYKPRQSGTVIKPWVIAGGTGGEMFFPLGMWRAARVEIMPRTYLERPFLVTEKADQNEAQLALTVEVFANADQLAQQLHPWDNRQLDNRSIYTQYPLPTALKTPAGARSLRIELLDRPTGRSAFAEEIPLSLNEGRQWVTRRLRVPKPNLWWPNGLGAQHLYEVRLSLMENKRAIDTLRFDYGIRTLRTEQSPGPRTADRWGDWQFVVNERKFFVKGINWMPADILLDLPPERYRWLLEMARAAGIQMVRIWGGGIIETEEFYKACNELGILVWQDFPIGNQDTPDYPQAVWEAQVVQTIFRLRNHPSLALYCGGNEFNPYSYGNATSIGILERSLESFDPTRPFRRTSPDEGSIHTYPDMDPTWYARLYDRVPFVAETGMHNLPEANTIREVVSATELSTPLSNMYSADFERERPDFRHHFVEFNPSRVPRMLSRASHIDDMSAPMLDDLAEASQIGAGEFYQIVTDAMLSNYPVTTGLLPWVYKRPWPVAAIQLVDGFGQPTAPYYFLKRAYEPTHVAVKLPHLIWAAGEAVPIAVAVVHAPPAAASAAAGRQVALGVRVFDRDFREVWQRTKKMTVGGGPSVTAEKLGEFTIPHEFEEGFFFLVAELRDVRGALISRSEYHPRCLTRMRDRAFREKYRATPQPGLTFDKGPWLKRQTVRTLTALALDVTERRDTAPSRSQLRLHLRNTGRVPAFAARVDIGGAKRAFYATDNYFWLAPGEKKTLDVEVLWREGQRPTNASVTAQAFNAATVTAKF